MNSMYLEYFTRDIDFPFLIQIGEHPDNMFIHSHDDFSELVSSEDIEINIFLNLLPPAGIYCQQDNSKPEDSG